MKMAISEACKGIGRTSPNPNVGAVIVADGLIVGKGFHKKAGTPHAEIHALADAGGKARGATIYVTLEPCNHTGRTAPCSKAIVASGIKKVVIGMVDPNPLVSGSGIEFMISKGIEVVTGILEEECEKINRPFVKYITKKIPWVIMKGGVSLDGKINYQLKTSGWITGVESSNKTHKLRNIVDAILVGKNTAIADNPSLTTRLDEGDGKDPVRVVIDSNLEISLDSHLINHNSLAPTWIFCCASADKDKEKKILSTGAKVYRVDGNRRVDLDKMLQVLGKHNITSLLVEGGSAIHGSMLREKLVDYAYLFIAPIFAGDSGDSLVSGLDISGRDKAIRLLNIQTTRLGQDVLIEGDILYPNC